MKELEKPIAELVEFIWKEAIGDLQEIFEFGFEKLTLEQVILMLGNKKLKYLLHCKKKKHLEMPKKRLDLRRF